MIVQTMGSSTMAWVVYLWLRVLRVGLFLVTGI